MNQRRLSLGLNHSKSLAERKESSTLSKPSKTSVVSPSKLKGSDPRSH